VGYLIEKTLSNRLAPFYFKKGRVIEMSMESIGVNTHEFKKGDWVHINGNRRIVAEVMDNEEEQLKVRILTQPNKGKIIYTTRYTYYTIPISEEEKEKLAEKLGIAFRNKSETKKVPVIIAEEKVAKKVIESNNIRKSRTDIPLEKVTEVLPEHEEFHGEYQLSLF
jgi:exopolysaccharide biosynthesis protein